MKFLSNADLVWGWGIFTRPVVIGSWIVLPQSSPHTLPVLFRWDRRPGLAVRDRHVFSPRRHLLILGLWLATGLSGRRLGELESFLPPADIHGAAGGELAWLLNDYETALAEAKQQDRPILVDFTGYTCTNCRWMEANMFPTVRTSRASWRATCVCAFTPTAVAKSIAAFNRWNRVVRHRRVAVLRRADTGR